MQHPIRRWLMVTLLAAMLGALVPAAASAQGWDPCGDALNGVYPRGYEVVWAPERGSSGSQIVIGTDGDDYLKGGSGDDILCGYGGNDVLEGNSGDDWMDAGTGFNELYGNSGNDTLIGMEGDVFVGNSGKNTIIANAPIVPQLVVEFLPPRPETGSCDYTVEVVNGPPDTPLYFYGEYTRADGFTSVEQWSADWIVSSSSGYYFGDGIGPESSGTTLDWMGVYVNVNGDHIRGDLIAMWEGPIVCGG